MNVNRKQKLETFVYAIREADDFSAEWAKQRCCDHAPVYVTRILKQLSRDGHLQMMSRDDQVLFRWVHNPIMSVEGWITRQIFGEQIKQSPEQDRPREQLLDLGAAKLNEAQLLAILIRVGVVGESAVQAGRRLANRFSSSQLADLPDASLSELKKLSPAIRKDSYCQVMAGIELGRRIGAMRDQQTIIPERIKGSDDAVSYCMKIFGRLARDGKQEEFHIVTLDTQHGPIGTHLITVGTLDASLVHPREVFRAAIRDSASAIILVHNHPSGDPTPSREDRTVTDRLTQVGELIGIRVLDHIIVARERGRSILAER